MISNERGMISYYHSKCRSSALIFAVVITILGFLLIAEAGAAIIHRRILILMFIAAAVCVMGVGIGAVCERMDLMACKSGAVKVLGRQSNRNVYCSSNYEGAKL
jgi:uncharacterized protein YqhQ